MVNLSFLENKTNKKRYCMWIYSTVPVSGYVTNIYNV